VDVVEEEANLNVNERGWLCVWRMWWIEEYNRRR